MATSTIKTGDTYTPPDQKFTGLPDRLFFPGKVFEFGPETRFPDIEKAMCQSSDEHKDPNGIGYCIKHVVHLFYEGKHVATIVDYFSSTITNFSIPDTIYKTTKQGKAYLLSLLEKGVIAEMPELAEGDGYVTDFQEPDNFYHTKKWSSWYSKFPEFVSAITSQ